MGNVDPTGLQQMGSYDLGTDSIANNQVASATTAGGTAAVAARAGRRRVLIKNLDASITVYVGTGTLSASNGMPILAGESIALYTTAAIKSISASGTPTLAYIEEF